MDWGTLLSVFGLVFVAELGDKTQLAVVTQTSRHRKPWAVFAGASAALTVITGLGAVGGQALGRLVPERVLRIAAALAFAAMGAYAARQATRAGRGPATQGLCDNPGDEQADGASRGAWDWKAFGSTLSSRPRAGPHRAAPFARSTVDERRPFQRALAGGL
jgi:uncharacterized membrane protein